MGLLVVSIKKCIISHVVVIVIVVVVVEVGEHISRF
jgi:hypothetical protein